MRIVVWKVQALEDVELRVQFLASKSPAAGQRAYLAIEEAALRLAEFPEIGRPMEDMPLGYRELLVPFSASGYRILYLDANPLQILAVRHMREAGY